MTWRDMFQPYIPGESVYKPEKIVDTARARLWLALDKSCGICGAQINTLAEVTYDHVVPRSKGGGNYGNIVPAHSTCNTSKADRMPRGCELVMLAALNAKAGNVFEADPMPACSTMRDALTKAGVA